MSNITITNLNLELTTACPLRCPQCYCSLDNGRHMDIQIAKQWILDAKQYGLRTVSLSGGETRCYPNLFELISYSRSLNVKAVAAFSGWGITQEYFDELVASGIHEIYISLNGSTEEINSKSRDGYQYAIAALQLLNSNQYKHTVINWVMHSHNTYDFVEVLRLAEKYGVNKLVVMAFKPDVHDMLPTLPTAQQINWVAQQIKEYCGPVKIGVESCYSQMLAVLRDTKLFGNLNVGPKKGCRAGLYQFSVNIDGTLSPCRHMKYSEKWDTVEDYWNNSPIIAQLQACNENNCEEPCKSCKYCANCRHCIAINTSINHRVFIGNSYCPFSMSGRFCS